MTDYIQKVSITARKAAQAGDWVTVKACAKEIIGRQRDNAEGYFLQGLAEKAANRPEQSIKMFSRALGFDDRRYDAAVEMAGQYLRLHQYGEAAKLLEQYQAQLENSPMYLDMAGTIYTNIGQPEKGWPLYKKANELQPGVPSLQANFAACNVYVGKIDEAREIYRSLLDKAPDHQRNHYELSRLGRAKDSVHVEQMQAVLAAKKFPPEKNIYINYALGKELEDLERWDESFHYYKMAGDAAASVGNYDVQTDIRIIDKIIEVCNADWLDNDASGADSDQYDKTPVFIVGLPRSGTTLTERILTSHSRVESVGESFFMQIVLKRVSGIRGPDSMSPGIIEAAAKKDMQRVAKGYMEAIAYRFGDKPLFVEKLPENFLYLGFIAKAFPDARIIHLNRNPMDNCFALYKQSFFRYAYRLDDLGPYYAAYARLRDHWRQLLGERLVEMDYEQLVSDQERQTRRLLDEIGLDFEADCLRFEKNRTASNTASSVQIREKIHVRSVNRWRCYEQHLKPLQTYMEKAGIRVA